MLLWGFALLHYSVAESSPGFLSRMHPTLLLRYSVSENIPEGGVVSDFSDNSVHVSLTLGHYALKVWFIGKFSFFSMHKTSFKSYKGVFSKPSGKCIVAPNLCFLS